MTTTTKKLVRVYMVDETKHGLMIDENTTAQQLAANISQKIGLTDYSHFAIFEVKGDEERCLAPEEKPGYLSDRWSPQIPLKASVEVGAGSSTENRLVFKKKIFVRDEDEQDVKDFDKVAKHMLYLQAHHSVIDGEYPCSVEDALKLAALQTQVIYGDHNPSNHVPGFFGANVSNFIPKQILPAKSTKEWEALIFKGHMAKKGLPTDEAETEYLNTVKAWPHYGTKYFQNCRLGGKHKLPAKVMIGVNLDGIVLTNNKDKNDILGNYLYTDLLSWTTSSQNALSQFSFEVSIGGSDPIKYVFDTKHAEAINDLVQSYVDVLIYMIKLDIGHETVSPRE